MSENNYGALMMKSAVGASDDINAIFQPGIYIIPPSNTSSPDATGGVLTVHSGTPIRRTFTSYSVICLTSTRNGSAWSAWKGPLSRTNPFADIKADGAAAIAEALSNLDLKEAAKRAVGTGAGQIPDMSAFEYVGNASAGYLKLPNGFKLQWLETPARVPASSTGVGYWTYPFSVCLFAIAVPVAVTPNTTAGNVVAGAFSYAAVELHNWGQISASARIIGVGR